MIKTNSTLQKYLFVHLLKTFIPVCLFFITVFAMTEFFWRLPDFMNHKPSFLLIIKYLSLHIPLWFVQTLPMSTMLSTLLVLSHFCYTKEVIALKTIGVNTKKFFVSWIFFGIVLSVVSFYINDKVAPPMFRTAQKIFSLEIKKENDNSERLYNLTYYNSRNIFGNIGVFDKITHKVYDFLLEQLDDDGKLVSQLYSSIGEKNNSVLVLKNVVIREYKNSYLISEKFLEEYNFPLEIDLEDFQYDYSDKPLDQLTILELKNIIKVAKFRGQSTARYYSELIFRYTLPFVNVILMLISIPLGLRTSSNFGRLVSFVYTIVAVIVYWLLLSLFRSMSEMEVLSPIIAMWLPNVLFLVAGSILYFESR